MYLIHVLHQLQQLRIFNPADAVRPIFGKLVGGIENVIQIASQHDHIAIPFRLAVIHFQQVLQRLFLNVNHHARLRSIPDEKLIHQPACPAVGRIDHLQLQRNHFPILKAAANVSLSWLVSPALRIQVPSRFVQQLPRCLRIEFIDCQPIQIQVTPGRRFLFIARNHGAVSQQIHPLTDSVIPVHTYAVSAQIGFNQPFLIHAHGQRPADAFIGRGTVFRAEADVAQSVPAVCGHGEISVYGQ